MKATDLIEILEVANRSWKKKHGAELHIFDLEWDGGDMNEGILISGSTDVVYRYDDFNSSKSTSKVHGPIHIRLDVEGGKVVDRSIDLEPDEDES